jgi:hypothetical protein
MAFVVNAVNMEKLHGINYGYGYGYNERIATKPWYKKVFK